MRPSRVFRLLFRIFILILSLSVTIVSALGAYSAVVILSDFDTNIGWDIDNAVIDAQINETTYKIDEFNFSLPVYFINTGFFDLENLELTISLEMNYSQVDYPTSGMNTTRQIEILWKHQNFGDIPKGQRRDFNFSADISNFIPSAVPDFSTEVDLTRGPPAVIFYANLILSLDYSLGLHSITFGMTNLNIGEI